MNKQIFTVALLAGSLASVSTLPAQDNRRSNTRQATVEDRLDQLEQNVADLQERVKRLEEGQHRANNLPAVLRPHRSHPDRTSARGNEPKPKARESSNRLTFFTRGSNRVATGLMTRPMEKSGNLTSRVRMPIGGRIAMGTGPTQIKVGLGFQMKTSDGQPITMDVG